MTHFCTNYVKLMHERGFRFTLQRQLILDAICTGNGHTNIDEIYERVGTKASTLHLGTIYRNLDFLTEIGLVVSTRIEGRMLYEIASETPHHHLVCRTCGSVMPLSHDTVKTLFDKVERKHHFDVDMNHLTLFGYCSKCRRAK